MTDFTPPPPPPGYYYVYQRGEPTLHKLEPDGRPPKADLFAAKDKIDSDGKPSPSSTFIILPEGQKP